MGAALAWGRWGFQLKEAPPLSSRHLPAPFWMLLDAWGLGQSPQLNAPPS